MSAAARSSGIEVVALVGDLMFGSRIGLMVGRVGGRVRTARTAVEVEKLLGSGEAELVVVDLGVGRDEAMGAMAAARASGDASEGLRVVAFGPHVAGELLAAARSAGADDVWPRSAFDGSFAALLDKMVGDGAD